jgi:hypothetical protein
MTAEWLETLILLQWQALVIQILGNAVFRLVRANLIPTTLTMSLNLLDSSGTLPMILVILKQKSVVT